MDTQPSSGESNRFADMEREWLHDVQKEPPPAIEPPQTKDRSLQDAMRLAKLTKLVRENAAGLKSDEIDPEAVRGSLQGALNEILLNSSKATPMLLEVAKTITDTSLRGSAVERARGKAVEYLTGADQLALVEKYEEMIRQGITPDKVAAFEAAATSALRNYSESIRRDTARKAVEDKYRISEQRKATRRMLSKSSDGDPGSEPQKPEAAWWNPGSWFKT